MKILMIKALWGMTGPLERQFDMIAKAGYDGIEGLPPSPNQAVTFKRLLKEYQFAYISQLVTQSPNHLASFNKQIKWAASFDPLSITVHSAKDHMPFPQQLAFFQGALKAEQTLGIPINHETHRSRAMFTPWTTARLLRAFPRLSLAADFSHWCCVTESLLQPYEADVSLACTRARHIHARVGYEQGPQVPDPRAPEYRLALLRHERWWDAIVAHQRKRRASFLTLTPEFGPPDYLHTLPFSRKPVAPLWDICLWMAKRLKKKYGVKN